MCCVPLIKGIVRLQFSEHRKKRHPDKRFGINYYSCYPCQCLSMSYKDMLKHESRVNKTANVMFDGQNERHFMSDGTSTQHIKY